MKNMLKTALIASFLVPLAASAQVQWFVTLDEYGNGTAVNGTSTTPLPGALLPDPSGGLVGVNVLVYTLPFNFPAGSVGDYLMLEPTTYSSVSDVVRFWAPQGQGGNQVIFYSDLDTGEDQLPVPWADTGLPASYLSLHVTLFEGGSEGGYQAVMHTAASGEPGYIGAGLGNYTFISDVPEPGTLALAGSCFAGLVLMAYRRRGK
ncbi:MAG: PEP-CTERM sorting domain-containing protein [Verrucomicrobiota bacterium]|jgi:hypothetical protein